MIRISGWEWWKFCSLTGRLSEEGRKKNLDRVFFTSSIGSARIYAGRAAAVDPFEIYKEVIR